MLFKNYFHFETISVGTLDIWTINQYSQFDFYYDKWLSLINFTYKIYP
jgi:hypothetical protein